ncbi:MAG: MerR family transcriptional regulator [Micromonosporaceae bacterium]
MTTTPDLVPIGEAARRLGLATSALRYYDERGIVRPARRVGGRRLYGRDELRRLAFVQLLQRLGVDLDTIAATLDDSGPPWASVVKAHLAWLDDRIAAAEAARRLLRHAAACPHERPWRNCPYLLGVLDSWLSGAGPAGPEVDPPGDVAGGLTEHWPDPWLARLAPGEGDDTEPLVRFGDWLHEALLTEPDPHAVTVATTGADGAPHLVTAWCDGPAGGQLDVACHDPELARNVDSDPRIALLFSWRATHREVRVTGTASRTDAGRYQVRPETIDLRAATR